MSQKIRIEKTAKPKIKPAVDEGLGFGKHFTDHMFMMPYHVDRGWHDPAIVPYAPLQLDPACMVFHYAQAVFEGLKAYRRKDHQIQLFRPELNIQRLNRSNERLGIPALDEDLVKTAIETLVAVDADWVPSAENTSLYIRPFVIATDEYLGVSVSKTYLFLIILSPSGAYYEAGMNPVKIYIENQYVRAVRGDTGEAKCAGNYAASLLAQEQAHQKGFAQVLWLDGVEQRYVEEVGSMNVFFVMDHTVVTPALSGSILPGITRQSVIELLRHQGMAVVERRISVDEIVEKAKKGLIQEAFGTGTAAVISPIGELSFGDQTYCFNEGKTGAISRDLYESLTGIQYGTKPDELGWTSLVKVEK